MADRGAPSGGTDERADPRIDELRRRWQERPTPRAGLQLAEELRRSGRLEEAQEVLERSLDENPGHLSSLVALGKTRLELEDAAGAVRNFEQVVDRDPTHLVANKLLIDAYLLQGDPESADSRLEHYRLLNGGDVEIESLAARVAELAAELAEASVPEASVQSPEPADPPADSPPMRAEVGGGDPFPSLGIGDRRRYLDGLRASGLFPLPDPPAPKLETAAAPAPAAPRAAPPQPSAHPQPEEPLQPEEPAQPEPSAAAPPAVEPPAAPVADSVPEPEAEEPDAVEDLELPRPERARATSTLGDLYLAQDHLSEAEDVFRRVLEASPNDHAATAGLAEVSRRRRRGLTAGALLRWAADSEEVSDSETGGDRRAALLSAYRARLRSRAASETEAGREESTDVS